MERKASRNKKKLIILYMALILSMGAMAFFAIALVLDARTIRQGQTFYVALSVDIKPRSFQPAPPILTSAGDNEGPLEVYEPYEPYGPFIDFYAKREFIPDIVAWIQSEGTVINYPIVQGKDNYYYLYRLADGSRHVMGSIFLDYRNSANFSDQVMIIYGHDMRSGDMFGSLRYYADQLYFEQHYSMFIFTPYQNFRLMLLAGYVINSAYEVPPMGFSYYTDFELFIQNARNRSIFRSDVEIYYGYQIAILVTCTPAGSVDDRLIIIGKLEGI